MELDIDQPNPQMVVPLLTDLVFEYFRTVLHSTVTFIKLPAETLGGRTSEREGRLIGHDGDGAMERKNQGGCF